MAASIAGVMVRPGAQVQFFVVSSGERGSLAVMLEILSWPAAAWASTSHVPGTAFRTETVPNCGARKRQLLRKSGTG